jgi:hypothetical protein
VALSQNGGAIGTPDGGGGADGENVEHPARYPTRSRGE